MSTFTTFANPISRDSDRDTDDDRISTRLSAMSRKSRTSDSSGLGAELLGGPAGASPESTLGGEQHASGDHAVTCAFDVEAAPMQRLAAAHAASTFNNVPDKSAMHLADAVDAAVKDISGEHELITDGLGVALARTRLTLLKGKLDEIHDLDIETCALILHGGMDADTAPVISVTAGADTAATATDNKKGRLTASAEAAGVRLQANAKARLPLRDQVIVLKQEALRLKLHADDDGLKFSKLRNRAHACLLDGREFLVRGKEASMDDLDAADKLTLSDGKAALIDIIAAAYIDEERSERELRNNREEIRQKFMEKDMSELRKQAEMTGLSTLEMEKIFDDVSKNEHGGTKKHLLHEIVEMEAQFFADMWDYHDYHTKPEKRCRSAIGCYVRKILAHGYKALRTGSLLISKHPVINTKLLSEDFDLAMRMRKKLRFDEHKKLVATESFRAEVHKPCALIPSRETAAAIKVQALWRSHRHRTTDDAPRETREQGNCDDHAKKDGHRQIEALLPRCAHL